MLHLPHPLRVRSLVHRRLLCFHLRIHVPTKEGRGKQKNKNNIRSNGAYFYRELLGLLTANLPPHSHVQIIHPTIGLGNHSKQQLTANNSKYCFIAVAVSKSSESATTSSRLYRKPPNRSPLPYIHTYIHHDDGWMDRWMDEWVDGCMDAWIDGWIHGWMDGCMDRWMDTWIHG